MAPEVVNDPQHVSEKADVWSLGMVLWELLTLEIPFASLSPQHIIHGLMLGNLQPPVRPRPIQQYAACCIHRAAERVHDACAVL
jgi:serine/threonine protein kinase